MPIIRAEAGRCGARTVVGQLCRNPAGCTVAHRDTPLVGTRSVVVSIVPSSAPTAPHPRHTHPTPDILALDDKGSGDVDPATVRLTHTAISRFCSYHGTDTATATVELRAALVRALSDRTVTIAADGALILVAPGCELRAFPGTATVVGYTATSPGLPSTAALRSRPGIGAPVGANDAAAWIHPSTVFCARRAITKMAFETHLDRDLAEAAMRAGLHRALIAAAVVTKASGVHVTTDGNRQFLVSADARVVLGTRLLPTPATTVSASEPRSA